MASVARFAVASVAAASAVISSVSLLLAVASSVSRFAVTSRLPLLRLWFSSQAATGSRLSAAVALPSARQYWRHRRIAWSSADRRRRRSRQRRVRRGRRHRCIAAVGDGAGAVVGKRRSSRRRHRVPVRRRIAGVGSGAFVVAVGGTALVAVGGTGAGVAVGGTGVLVAVGVAVGGTAVSVAAAVKPSAPRIGRRGVAAATVTTGYRSFCPLRDQNGIDSSDGSPPLLALTSD